jgi:protein-S-isoprenylcysteine O-methyltransferase Ste14
VEQLGPLAVTRPYALVFWIVMIWAYAPEFRIIREARRAQRSGGADRRDPTLFPLIVGQQVVIFVAVFLAFTARTFAMSHFRTGIFVAGVALVIAGGLMRRHCFRMLGTDFRGAVTVREGQPVVDRGAYRFLRHPSYAAAMLLHLGLALAFSNWATVAVIALGIPPLFIYRIVYEERALLRQLGTPYATYVARTRRLVPGLW